MNYGFLTALFASCIWSGSLFILMYISKGKNWQVYTDWFLLAGFYRQINIFYFFSPAFCILFVWEGYVCALLGFKRGKSFINNVNIARSTRNCSSRMLASRAVSNGPDRPEDPPLLLLYFQVSFSGIHTFFTQWLISAAQHAAHSVCFFHFASINRMWSGTLLLYCFVDCYNTDSLVKAAAAASLG